MSYGFTAEGDRNLRRLAEETGGRVEYPLENVYKDVIAYLEKPQDAGNFALSVGTGAYASQMAQGCSGRSPQLPAKSRRSTSSAIHRMSGHGERNRPRCSAILRSRFPDWLGEDPRP